MANFLNYIVESTIQPVKTNVLWIKNGVPYYYNKRWKPLLGGGGGGGATDCPISYGEGEYSAVLKNSNNKALNERNIALGFGLTTNNLNEIAIGRYNKSIASNVRSQASLFTVGNGSASGLNNAFEIKQNGDIYIQGIEKSLQNCILSFPNYDEDIKQLNYKISLTEESLNIKFEELKTDLEDRIEENTSSITQTAEEIVLLVGRVEDTEGDITTLSSSITQTAESITSEVNVIKEELEGKVEANTSLIQQTSDNITLLVNNSIENLNNKDAELEGLIKSNTASIKINADAITSKVSQETFDIYKGEVSTQFTEVNQTIEGITTTISDIDGNITEIRETADGLGVRLSTAEADIESLKKQSDGSIETHFGTIAPTLDNEPAVNWTTNEEKYEHTGDIYYNNNTGEAYRFSYNPETGLYFWVELTDSALTDALDKISKLESAIDGKVTIFYSTPTNYKYGDIWFVHADNESFKEGTLVSATNIDKNTIRETLVLSDWAEKTNYVDTESLTEEVTNLNNYIDTAFKDGVLSEAEITHIKELKKNFELAYKELNELYSLLIITVFATEEEEASLVNAKSTLDTAYNALISAIDNLNTNADESGVNQSLQVYENAYQAYLDALQEYSRIASLIQEGAESELLKPYEYIKNIASDGFITPIEKKQLLEIWKSISEEFAANRSIAVNYKIIHLVNEEYVQRTDIFEDSSYYNIYNAYAFAYNNIANIFTEDDSFGFKNLEETTDLSEKTITSLQEIEELFNVYYITLGDFSEMISKITIDITDAHQVVIDLANNLVEQLDPREAITQIGKGVVLSSVIGVKDVDGKLEAVLNGSDNIAEAENAEHGKIVFAGGINGASDWNNATTIIYEDGHIVMKSGEIGEYVEVGNALITAVSSGKIDLFSYPQTVNGVTTLIPLFQVNKDDTGKIVSISSVFDFIGNKNIWALEQVSSGGVASEGEGGGSGGASALAELLDVSIESPEDGEVLSYDTVTGLWVNKKSITEEELTILNNKVGATETSITLLGNRVTSVEENIDSLEGRSAILEGYFTNGIANNASKLGGQLPSYYATASGLSTTNNTLSTLRSEFDALYATLNDDTAGVIDTWTEVVDFVNEYSGSEDLSTILAAMNADIATRAKQADLNSAVSRIVSLETLTGTHTSKIASLDSLTKSHSSKISSLETLTGTHTSQIASINANFANYRLLTNGVFDVLVTANKGVTTNELTIGGIKISVVDGQLFIDGDVAASGRVSAGGVSEEGGGSSDTSGILILDNWSDYDSTLNQVLGAALGVDLNTRLASAESTLISHSSLLTNQGSSLSSLESRVSATESDIEALESKATAVSFAQTLTSGKEIGSITIDGTSTKLYAPSSYAWSAITSKPTTLAGYGITDAYTATSVNSLLSGYLPLSGGTLVNDTWGNLLVLKINGTSGQTLTFANTNGTLGHIGVSGTGYPFFANANEAVFAILHAGNFNTYAPTLTGTGASGNWGIGITGGARFLKQENLSNLEGTDDLATSPIKGMGLYVGTTYANSFGDVDAYGAALFIGYGDYSRAGRLIYGRHDDSALLFWQNANSNATAWGRKRQIAFIDSDITGNSASATKLATARSLWGNSFDGTGDVGGSIFLSPGKHFYGTTTNGTGLSLLNLDSTYGDFYLGQGTVSNNYSGSMYIYGNNIAFFSSTSRNRSFMLNSSGNVTIGSDDLAGANYKLYVGGKLFAGNGLIEGSFSVNGATTLNSTLEVKSNAKFSSTAYFEGWKSNGTYASWRIASAAEGLYWQAGNINGTTKTGSLYLSGISGAYLNDFNILATSSYIKGSLSVIGSTTLSSSLSVSGLTSLASRLLVGGINSDTGESLIVNGNIRNKGSIFSLGTYGGYYFYTGVRDGEALSIETYDTTPTWKAWAMRVKTDGQILFLKRVYLYNRLLVNGATDDGSTALQVNGDLHVSGNIVADGQVSAGGVAAEGVTSLERGSSLTRMTFSIPSGTTTFNCAHNLATREVTVNVYEAEAPYQQVLTNVYLSDENTAQIVFDSATDVAHTVVVIG